MANRERKGYRFSPRTLKLIAWLSDRLDQNATSVLETAIERLFAEQWSSLRARLIPRQDGWYDLVIGGLTVLSVEEPALARLGAHLEELMTEEGGAENLFGVVVLAAGTSGSKLGFYNDNIQRIYGPILEEAERAAA